MRKADKHRGSTDNNDSSVRAPAFEIDSNASTFLVDVSCDAMVIVDLIRWMSWLRKIVEKSTIGAFLFRYIVD